jgi:adhesin/invasin
VTDSNDFLVAAPSMQRTRIGDTDIFLSRLRFGAQPGINPNGVVNAATFQAGVAPLGLATIFGQDLARGTETASATPLPGSLGGAEVLVNGVPAPLYYASPTQINFQMRSVPAGPNTISVRVGGETQTANFTANVMAAAPGIFFHQEGNHAVAQNGDFSLNTPENPVRPGETIIVYLTDIGPTDVFIGLGQATPPIQARAVLPSSATIGGRPATVQFLGLTPGFVGLAQANLVVPAGLPDGRHAVTITVGGNQSNSPVISVDAP